MKENHKFKSLEISHTTQQKMKILTYQMVKSHAKMFKKLSRKLITQFLTRNPPQTTSKNSKTTQVQS